jgi:hypothetical protein
MSGGFRQGSVLSPMLFNVVIDEIIIRVTEGQDSEIPTIMVCIDDRVIWEPNENTLQNKFQRVITVCKDSELNVNLDKYVMKISQKKVMWKR